MANTDKIEWTLLDTDLTSRLAIMPAAKSNLYLELNEPGSGQLEIPLDSETAAAVGSGMLAQANYRGAARGAFLIDNLGHAHADSTEGAGRWLKLSGRGGMALLDEAIIFDDGSGSTRTFTDMTKAGILIALIDEAQARGSLANLTYDFTDTDDSASVAWDDSETYALNVGTTILDVLRQFVKIGIDFDVQYASGNFVLSAYKNGKGTDLSETIYFRVGTNCEEVFSDERGDGIRNALRVAYKGGYLSVSDAVSIAARRRREKLLDIRDAQTSASATTYAAAIVDKTKDPKKSISVKIFDGVGPRVFIDYALGDYIMLDVNGVETRYRIYGIQLVWDGEKFADVVVDLNSIIYENDLRMARDIDWLLDQWATAHDANLLEVSFWAGIGDPYVVYPTLWKMAFIGSKLYVGGSQYLASYETTTGIWTNIPCTLSIQGMKALGTKLYLAALDPAASGISGVCDNYAFVYDTVSESLSLLAGGLGVTGAPPPSSTSLCVEVNGTDVYFGGRFDIASSGTVGSVARYDTVGGTWNSMGAGALTSGKAVYALLHDGTFLYAGGNFTTIGGAAGTGRVAMHNGSVWLPMDSGFPSGEIVHALKAYNGNVLAGGSFAGGVSEWDGSVWTVLGGGTNLTVYDIEVYLTDVYATGSFTSPQSMIAKYSGGAWSGLEEGLSGGNGTDLELYNNGDGVDVFVLGAFTTAGDKTVNKIAAYFTNFEGVLDYLENASSGFNLAAAIHAATSKSPLVGADEMGFWDSVTGLLRKITWTNILASGKTYFDTLYVALTGNQTVAGIKTFSSFPVTPSSAPTTDYQVVNKKYVDDNGAGLVDGDYGDITVSGSGTVMSLDDNVMPDQIHAAPPETSFEADAEIGFWGGAAFPDLRQMNWTDFLANLVFHFSTIFVEITALFDDSEGDPEDVAASPSDGTSDFAARRDHVHAGSTGGGAVPHAPGGRPTLVTLTPVMTTEQAAKTTIYYTPYIHDLCPIWNGSEWEEQTVPELSLPLDSDSGHTGYHQSGKNFDLFVIDDAGTQRLVSGPAWVTDTTRGTGAGTTELELKNGIKTNKNSITVRFGAASGNTLTLAANKGTCIGSFRASANGTTTWELGGTASTGDPGFLNLSSMYNQIGVGVNVSDSDDSWTYSTNTVRAKNGSNNNRISFINSNNDEAIYALVAGMAANSGGTTRSLGVGIDSVTVYAGVPGFHGGAAGLIAVAFGAYSGAPGLGLHFIQACEAGAAANTTTFYGDAGQPTFAGSGISALIMM